jgi:hypothetical protein
VKFCRAAPVSTIPAGQGTAGGAGLAGGDAAELPGTATVIAIRAADLVSPAGRLPAGATARRWWWPAPRRSAPGIGCCS